MNPNDKHKNQRKFIAARKAEGLERIVLWLNLLRLKSKGSVVLSACGARVYPFPTEVGGFKPRHGK